MKFSDFYLTLIGPVVSEEKMFEKWTTMMDGGDYKLTDEPSAQVS